MMLSKKLHRLALSFFAVVLAAPVLGYAQCVSNQLGAGKPVVVRSVLSKETNWICFTGINILHSGVTRTPLFAAEHLTRDRIEQAKILARIDSFHEETSLPRDQGARLKDYVRSGYDRGHMAPNKDMSNAQMQGESFSLANIVPQDPHHNRYMWEGIESSTRRLIEKAGEGYVVTGPAFMESTVRRIGGRVLVPSHIWKAIYIPRFQQAGAYWTANSAESTYEEISIHELTRKIGVDVFPNLPDAVKQAGMQLPKPTVRNKP